MNRIVKIVGIIAAILVGLIIVFAVLAKIFITPERVRAAVVPIAEDALEREVRIGDIEIRLLSGIVIRDLLVLEKDGAETFVAADQVVLRYRFWPLLLRRVIIDEIRLDAPSIRIVRFDDGTFNFSDLMEGEPEPVDRVERPPEPGPPIDLLVSDIAMAGGEIIFLDHVVGGAEGYRLHLTDLTARVRNLSPIADFPFDAGLRLNDAVLKLTGTANLQKSTGTVRVVLDGFDTALLAPYIRDHVPGQLETLMVNTDITVEGGAERVAVSGRIALEQLNLTLAAMPEAPIRNAALRFDTRVVADLATSLLDIGELRADLNGIPAQVTGQVQSFMDEPRLDLRVTIPETNIRTVLAALPPAIVKDIDELNPAGAFRVGLHLAGTVDQPARRLQAGPGDLRPELNGILRIKGDTLSSEGLNLVMGRDRANIDLKATNLFGDIIVVTQSLTADRFDLEPVLAATGAPAAAPAEEREPVEIGPFDLPLKVDGTIQLGQTVYRGLQISNFDCRYRLENNIFTLEKLTGQIAGGTFNQTARVDLGRPGLAYQANFGLEGLQADPLISAFVPGAAGTVFGTLNLKAKVEGRGTLSETLRRNLSGTGEILLADGQLTGTNLVQGFAQFLNVEKLRVLQFSRAAGSFTISDGRVRIASDITGSDIAMQPRGTIGLDGSLDLALNARLAPELTGSIDRGRITRFLVDEKGWGQLPIRVAGNLNSPRFALDTAAVQEKAKEEIQKKLQEQLLERLAPPAREPEDPQQEKDNGRKLLEDSIRGIFRR
jgi:AsmA protein